MTEIFLNPPRSLGYASDLPLLWNNGNHDLRGIWNRWLDRVMMTRTPSERSSRDWALTRNWAVRVGDIISVAASSVKPVNISNDWLKKGSTIIFTGRCNIDEPYYLSSKIYWDNARMHEVYYDEHMLLPENERFINGIGVQIYRMMYEGKLPDLSKQVSLGDVVIGSAKGRENDDERILFVTSGMPVWDIGWGYEIYQNAKKMGLGQSLRLWDSPYQAQ